MRQEIPFDLDLVGTLLEEIRCNLIGQNDQYYTLPELRVTKLDDITSCLSLLRDYITSWSHDMAKNSTVRAGELRRSRDKVEDLELQLQETILESESSEGTLLTHLQVQLIHSLIYSLPYPLVPRSLPYPPIPPCSHCRISGNKCVRLNCCFAPLNVVHTTER